METGDLTRRSGRIARLVALSLLFSQLGAAAHAYSHLSDDAKGGPVTTQICGACISFAAVGAAAAAPTSALQIDHCGSEAAVPAVPAAIALDPHYPAFRSRAPPAIL